MSYQTCRVFKEQKGLLVEGDMHLIQEAEIEIYCQNQHCKQVIATPIDLDALACGVLLSEGLLWQQKVHQITKQVVNQNTYRVNVTLINASDNALVQEVKNRSAWDLTLKQIKHGFLQMEQKQVLRQVTHASHAMAWLNKEGFLENIAEDVSRHAALYKLMGQRVLQNKVFDDGVILASSRISQTMVALALGAKVPAIVSVATPTAQAVLLAKENQIALASFMRSVGLIVYCRNEDTIRIRLA